MAPRRGRTLDAFLELCQGKFDIYLDEEFDGDVTLSHQKVITVTQNISRAQQLIPFYFVYTYRHFLKKNKEGYIYLFLFLFFYRSCLVQITIPITTTRYWSS
jgi:hypothetical protein